MGNNKQQRTKDRIERLKAKAKAGDPMAASNVSAEYRIMGRQRLAFRWWKIAADLGDGGAWLEVGYCCHHGIGTRRDLGAAANAYDAAIRSQVITDYGLEEAMYHRAVLLLQSDGSRWSRAKASKLLRQASGDGDYPEAGALFSSIKSGERVQPCCCRRGLKRSLGGSAYCRLHRDPRPKATQQAAGKGH
jgi:TPR repeat protein